MKSLKEAGQKFEALATEAARHYKRIDELEDKYLKLAARSKLTPVYVLAVGVIAFMAGVLFG